MGLLLIKYKSHYKKASKSRMEDFKLLNKQRSKKTVYKMNSTANGNKGFTSFSSTTGRIYRYHINHN